MRDVATPSFNRYNPADAICSHFLLHGFNKQGKSPVHAGCWSSDGRRLVLGTQQGEFTLWEDDSFKFAKLVTTHQHPIRAMGWSTNAQMLISGKNIVKSVVCWNPSSQCIRWPWRHHQVFQRQRHQRAEYSRCPYSGGEGVVLFSLRVEVCILQVKSRKPFPHVLAVVVIFAATAIVFHIINTCNDMLFVRYEFCVCDLKCLHNTASAGLSLPARFLSIIYYDLLCDIVLILLASSSALIALKVLLPEYYYLDIVLFSCTNSSPSTVVTIAQ